jgi:cellobiose phosphorylase
MGFRDSNQDLFAFVQMDPVRARQRIIDLAATQLFISNVFHQYQPPYNFSRGAYHQYLPLSKRGNNDAGSGFNDDPLWLVLSVAAYIKETGRWDILDELVPYENAPGTEMPLYDHLKKSIEYTLTHRSKLHNLPLIGQADWNDCLNLNCLSTEPNQSFQLTKGIPESEQVAESILIAGQFVWVVKEMAGIACKLGFNSEVEQYQAYAIEMEELVRRYGWDGEWFLRAYDHKGDKVGSHTCEEGQIYIEPQGMCVMAGIGIKNGLAQQALDSVYRRLATPYGIALLQPSYTQYHPELGEISSYPPGYKENGSVFCHNNAWILIAETILGNGDRAYDYYMRINPSAREPFSDVYRCEPYVFAQTIAGCDASEPGEAKNSWLTGTASWTYVAATQWILGIRATYDGLCIDPVIPTKWNNFKATRIFRGVTYQITVQRIGNGRMPSLEVDGQAIQGTIIQPQKDKKVVQVLVRLI